MKKLIVATISLFFILSGVSFAQGAMDQSGPESPPEYTEIIQITFAFVADGAGAVPDTDITASNLAAIGGMWLFQVITVPGTGTAPAAGWDIEILETLDGGSYDVMGGAIADRSATDTEKAVPLVVNAGQTFGALVPCNDTWTISVSNVGANAEGLIALYFVR